TKLGDAVRDQVIPRVAEPIKAANPDHEGLRLVVDELVTPILAALPAVVLPALPTVGSDEGALRLREVISALLLQSLARFTLSVVDVLLEHALTEADDAIQVVAQQIEELEEGWSGLAALATVASGAVLPISVTPADARGLLLLASEVIRRIN